MTNTNLIDLTVKELENICKSNGLTYYSGKRHLTKQEMVDKINNVPNYIPEEATNPVVEETNVVEEQTSESEEIKEPEVKEWVNSEKDEFIEKAEPGTLMAFYDNNGKPRTAALVNRSSNRKLVKLQTEFGWEFIVPYSNILWVKNGTRWPRGIYNLLKGYKKNG